MKSGIAGVLGLLIVLSAFGPARAVVVSTYSHTGSGFAGGTGADAHLAESSPAANYGAATVLEMRNQTNTHQQLPYLRIDLSGIDKASARRARLQLYDSRFDGSGPLRGNTFGLWALRNESLDNWSESGITWNSAPGHTHDGLAFDDPDLNADAEFLGNFTYTQAGSGPWSVPIDVPGLVDRVRTDTNGQLTLMIAGPAGSGTLFRVGSKETAVTSIWTATPIPAGSAASRLLVDLPQVVISTFDHDNDGLTSGLGADTWINENSKTANYGAGADLRLRDQPSGNVQEAAYLRFDLSALDKTMINDAKLQLYDYRFNEGSFLNGKSFPVWAMVNESLDAWSETGITWNSAPGHADDGLPFDDSDFNGDAVFLGNVAFSMESGSNGWTVPVSVPGLAGLVAQDANNLLTLMIAGPRGPASLFYVGSKETIQDRRATPGTILSLPVGTLAPRLIVSTLPEPSSVGLLLFPAAILVLLRWRIRRVS